MTINNTNYRQYQLVDRKRQGEETPIQATGSSARQFTSLYLSLRKMEIMRSGGKFYKLFFLIRRQRPSINKAHLSEGMHPICCQSTLLSASVC